MVGGSAEALLRETYGVRLLSYLCAADESDVAARLEGNLTLRAESEVVLNGELLPLATRVAADADEQPFRTAMRLSQTLGQYHEPLGISVGNAIRRAAGGEIAAPPDVPGRLETLLCRLAIDQFPALLVNRAEPWHPFGLYLFRHPDDAEVQQLVLADADLARLYPSGDPSGGRRGYMYTLNRGNSIQSVLMAPMAIQAAWDSVTVRTANPSPDDLCTVLLRHLDLLRGAIRGERVRVRALVAFTGIKAEDADTIAMPWGSLRPLGDHERRLASPIQEGDVTTTDDAGGQVTVSYGGELVLETTADYRLTIKPITDDPLPGRWPHIGSLNDLIAQTEAIQLAALLAIPRPPAQSVIARPAWTWIEQLFAFGSNLGWSDTRSAPGFVPYALTAEDCRELTRFCELIDRHRQPTADIAIRRVISAVQVRAEPADRLVDSVIAWENLFGTSEGEPRLRISAAMAWLLASDAATREALQLEIKAIYDARSKIVHGAAANDPDLPDQANRALGLALDSLRVLFSARDDVLRLGDGAKRSLRLILDLGGAAADEITAG